MAYSKFSRERLINELGLNFYRESIFPPPVLRPNPSALLSEQIEIASRMPLNNEKAFSEFLITPILVEVWKNQNGCFSIHSGENLDADSERGLKGPCDFILTADTRTSAIHAPVISIVEAKYEQFANGITQGAAQLYGAKIFNQKKGLQTDELWGCSANGKEWYFFKLKDNEVIQHPISYSYRNLPELLGVWDFVIKAALKPFEHIQFNK